MDDGGADTTARAGDDTGGVVAPAATRVPPKLGRYRIGDRLGAGGMGVVYLAYDPVLDRQVAIKVLRRSEKDRTHLEREAQAIARIHHPNVVVVHDVVTDGADVCVVMQYVRGTTLAEWLIAATPRPPQEILSRFVAAGRGLAAAHAAGLVHRDFKPENVLLGDDGAVVVTDFGLARLDATSYEDVEDAADEQQLAQTRSGSLSGTPRYMSPEQFRGDLIDARSDQFNFAVALWLALFQTHPLIPLGTAPNLEEHRALVVKGVIIPPRDPRVVGARVLAALRRALAVDPGQRFPTMSAFLGELAPRHRGRTFAIAGACVIAAGVGVAFLAGGSSANGTAAPPRSCTDAAASLTKTWNPDARARYLARATEPTQLRTNALRADIPDLGPMLADDAARFDVFVDAWTAVATADCRAPDPRRAACLYDQRDQLAAALTRPSLRGQPVLGDPRWCDRGGVHLAERVLRTSGSAAVFSPDGEQIAMASEGGGYAIVGLDGTPRPGDGLSLLRQWSGASAWSGGALASHKGDRRARIAPDALEIVGLDDTVSKRIPLSGIEHLHSWSPDDRRIVLDTRFNLAVVDLEHMRVESLSRLDHHAIGVASAEWRTPSELIVAGGVKYGLGDGLWRVRLDDNGAVRDIHALIPPTRNLALKVQDISGARVLVDRTHLSFATLRIGDTATTVAAPVEGSLGAVDVAAGRFVIIGQDSTSHLVDANGTLVDTARDTWTSVQNGALVRSEDRVACSALASARCVRVITRDGKGYLQGAGAPVPFEIPSYFTGLAISPDGQRAVVASNIGSFDIYDLATGEKTTTRVPGAIVQKAIFDDKGRDIIVAGIFAEGGFQLRTVGAHGKTTVLYSSPDWISGVDQWKDGALLITTRAFTSELVLLEGLPPI